MSHHVVDFLSQGSGADEFGFNDGLQLIVLLLVFRREILVCDLFLCHLGCRYTFWTYHPPPLRDPTPASSPIAVWFPSARLCPSGRRRAHGQHPLVPSTNSLTLATSRMAVLAFASANVAALKVSASVLLATAAVAMAAVSKIQPSQLTEEQRNATRL
ncbi:hypothetical protein QYE76_034730 [Lolium multiflorum]|uniref:Uncharacterized protein n=1 Tax=Lolium multiflorum TaxID=4521 RepID=A0AAD8VKH5_LOLMU|nr:hypothetical protein QYE76_034730 [Lolium multiflorum]